MSVPITESANAVGGIDPAGPATRPIRRDVVRNRALLIQAADELFSERGMDVTLDDIAKHAGVGVATAYRHFENKQALMEALFEDRIGQMVTILEEAEALEDPREAFEAFLYRACDCQSDDRGMRETMHVNNGTQKVNAIRERLQPIATRIIERAQAAGVLRPEFSVTDVPVIFWMIGTISDSAGDLGPDLWRRYLDFIIDGLLAPGIPHRPASVDALSVDQLQVVMESWHRSKVKG